ncbi:hypothetical protein ALO97_05590 [Pseudomonas syringae pv. tagetis]|nr:hypothetical protein ALO97_05590 [Pseudomonas syringae pv. tagetis]
MIMFDNGMETTCGCVVGGAGLAGMGFLFNALKSDAMPGLSAKGLIVIDACDRPGAGVLGDYRITANSVGDVFIDCLRDPALYEVFKPLENSAVYWRIKAQAQSAPQLADVGLLMAEAARLVLDHIVQRYGVKVWPATTINEVVSDGDEFCLHVEGPHGERQVRCRALVLNLGGHQDPRHLIDSLARQGLVLPGNVNIQSADRLLRMNAVQLREVFGPALARKGRITIVGGSHSAFSMLENLADALEFAGLNELTLIHRSDIKLFYEDVEQAKAAGYMFDTQRDVCPVSGRVNRSGGLRYRALDIGREALSSGRVGKTGVRVHMLQTLGGRPDDYEQARLALADSAVIVQCSGYQPVLPALKDTGGNLISLRETKGGLESDACGCPVDQQGRRVKGLYLFGLGAGLGIDPQLGSEPAFDGRIYGVWQFHHDASGAVLKAVAKRLSCKAAALEVFSPDEFVQAALRVQVG